MFFCYVTLPLIQKDGFYYFLSLSKHTDCFDQSVAVEINLDWCQLQPFNSLGTTPSYFLVPEAAMYKVQALLLERENMWRKPGPQSEQPRMRTRKSSHAFCILALKATHHFCRVLFTQRHLGKPTFNLGIWCPHFKQKSVR